MWSSVTTGWKCGASVAHLSERSPLTSEVAGSILSENVPNVTRIQCSWSELNNTHTHTNLD